MTEPAERFWAALPLGKGVSLLACDANGLAALCKPAGVLSHPNEAGEEGRSLLAARYDLARERYEWAGGALWLLNRLDSATSGVVLAAAGGPLAEAVREQFRRREVRKGYRALVFGVPRTPRELWRDRLAVERRGGRIRSSAGAGARAESAMRLLRAGRREPRVSLLALEPRTGRSHQLRVQCARRGLPIVGDQTYGDFASNRAFARASGMRRLFLHSLSAEFDYAYAGRTFAFSAEAPLPPEFEAWL